MMRGRTLRISTIAAIAAAACIALAAVELDMTGSTFDPAAFDEGIPKDAFKAMLDPVYMPLADAYKAGKLYYAGDDSWFFLMRVGTATRLYPMGLMNWHHVANEAFGTEPVGVSYCLLTGSSVAFASRLPERKKSFGVAGSLYNSNLIMYDKQTGSLWTQLDLKAYSGVEKGRTLPLMPIGWVRASYAKSHYAKVDTLVGSLMYKDFLDMYGRLPGDNLEGYSENDSLLGPVLPAALADKSYPMKELFVLFPKEGKAFRFDDAPAFPSWLDSTVEGGKIQQLLPKEGKPFITLYWFAMKAFYPDAQVLKPAKRGP